MWANRKRKENRNSSVRFGKTEFLSKITSRYSVEMRIQDADRRLDEITFQFSFTVTAGSEISFQASSSVLVVCL